MSKVGNTIKAIQISINKADIILNKIKPLLGDEANKKINDNFVSSVRTESSVKEAEKKIESLFNLHNKA